MCLQSCHDGAHGREIANLFTFLYENQLSINDHECQRFKPTMAAWTKNVLRLALPSMSPRWRIDDITQLVILVLRSSASCKFGLHVVSLQACAMYSAAAMCRYLSHSHFASATASWLAVGLMSDDEPTEVRMEQHGKFCEACKWLLRGEFYWCNQRSKTLSGMHSKTSRAMSPRKSEAPTLLANTCISKRTSLAMMTFWFFSHILMRCTTLATGINILFHDHEENVLTSWYARHLHTPRIHETGGLESPAYLAVRSKLCVQWKMYRVAPCLRRTATWSQFTEAYMQLIPHPQDFATSSESNLPLFPFLRREGCPSNTRYLFVSSGRCRAGTMHWI